MSRTAEASILSSLQPINLREIASPQSAGRSSDSTIANPHEVTDNSCRFEEVPTDEIELGRRLRTGDPGAFSVIMERYWKRTFLYVRQIERDPDRAYDVAQETFARLWEKRRGWESSGTIGGWLLRTARNLAISEYRRGKVRTRWRATIGRESIPAPRTPLQDFEREELRSAIQRAVQALPPRRREVFVLFHVHHLSYREIGELLDIRRQTIANHLQHAVMELREALAPFKHTLRSAGDSGAEPGDEDARPAL